MPEAVEMSGRALRWIKRLSQYTGDAILLHTQEVADSNPALRTIPVVVTGRDRQRPFVLQTSV
jgi:hypothetical protein